MNKLTMTVMIARRANRNGIILLTVTA